MFGGQQNKGLFGSSQPFGQAAQPTVSTGTGLFGQQPVKSMFGQAQPTTGLGVFGQQTSAATQPGLGVGTSGGLFGGQNKTFFSSPTSTTQQISGTTLKLDPLKATDTMVRNNETKSINTKLMCLTAMKAYEMKSLEVCFFCKKQFLFFYVC